MNNHCKYIVCVLLLFFSFSKFCSGQDFTNPNLDGIMQGVSSLPTNWESVPASDPVCIATIPGISDTPDLTDQLGPDFLIGIAATPQSSPKCLTGLCGSGAGDTWHEGIMQTVYGLTVGAEYQITFYQAVVRQKNVESTSGYWKVYKDNIQLGATDPSFSTLSWSNPDVQWDFRTINFIATLDSHTFKFMPHDSELPRDVRMGIDNIHLNCVVSVDLGPDTSFCKRLNLVLDATAPNSTYLWEDGSTEALREITETGIYYVEVNNGCAADYDTIEVVTYECPVILDMPNVFTPNGDGSNDLFSPIQINEISSWQIQIVNRWGVTVWQSNDLNESWDGTTDGEPCPDGVYYWVIQAWDSFDDYHNLSGVIHLISN